MPIFRGQFASIILLGKHNPQTLNHDFLVGHNVLPREFDPFRLLSEEWDPEKKPFSEFIPHPRRFLNQVRPYLNDNLSIPLPDYR